MSKTNIHTKDEVSMLPLNPVHFIINPASRSGRGLKIWKNQIQPALDEKKIIYKSYFSTKTGNATEIAGKISSDSGTGLLLYIIVVGGDGTVNEVLQGIREPSRLVLGYIPTGSGNDLARDLSVPKNPLDALDLILHGKRTPMDLGTITYPGGSKRHFLISCGLGYDAAVCEEVNRSAIKKVLNKIGLGKLIYLGIALKQLFAAKKVSCELTLDNDTHVTIDRMLFTCCMLHRFEGGGFMFAPDADAHDGILNLCAVGDISKLLILFALPTAFYGKHYRFQGITPYHAKEITMEAAAPLWVHTDGEVTRKESRITVSCEKDAFFMLL